VPRASKVEACMLCGDTPCSCNAKPGKPKTATARVSRAVEKPVRERLAPSLQADEEQLLIIGAVRTLASILHPTELARYSGVLASPPTLRERSVVWRARRESTTPD
jgi:hypothetical protein